MTDDLACTSWPSYGGCRARCMDPWCDWTASDPSPAASAEAARVHTRETGHRTRVRHTQVTEFTVDAEVTA